MFATADDIIVNEITTPTQVGHYSIKACDTVWHAYLGRSRAPLFQRHFHAPAVMLNVHSATRQAARRYVPKIQAPTFCMCGKTRAKHNHKIGHVTLFSDEPDNVDESLGKNWFLIW